MDDLQAPALDELADEHDMDGWDINRHGRFRDFATSDDAVTTIPWED